MRVTLTIVGVILIVFGCIWFLQGIGVLPGSGQLGIGGTAERLGAEQMTIGARE